MLRVQGRKSGAGRMHAVLDGAGSSPGVRRHGGAVSNLYARLRLQCRVNRFGFVAGGRGGPVEWEKEREREVERYMGKGRGEERGGE